MLGIQLIGFSERMKHSLQLAVGNRCPDRLALTEDGDVLLIDLEGAGGAESVRQLAEQTDRPVVVLSMAASVGVGDHHLQKPLGLSKLLALLPALETGRRTAPPPASPDSAASGAPASPKPPKQALPVQSLPRKDYADSFLRLLCDLLAETRRSRDDRTVEVAIKPDKYLRIDPRSERIATNFTHGALRVLAITPCSVLAPSVRRIADAPGGDGGRGQGPDDLEALIWRILETGYRGTLVADVDPANPCRLAAWPNLVKLAADPKYFALAGYWTRQPAAPRDLAAMFGLAADDLVQFVNFAWATQLLRGDGPAHVARLDPAPAESGVRTVLRRLLHSVSKRAA